MRELPLFPLHVVLFPGRPLPLHVFEPRYRTMLQDCLDGDGRFGVVAIRSGSETAEASDLFRVGTEAQIIRVEELEDGRSNIITVGTDRFRVLEQLPAQPYRRAVVEAMDDVDADEPYPANGVTERLRRLLVPYLREMGASEDIADRLPEGPAELAWLAAAAVQMDLPEQQRLLELDSTRSRVERVIELLRRESGLMRHFGSVGPLRPPGPGGVELN